MMTQMLKRLAFRLPRRLQQELKRLYFARLIRKGLFEKAIENEGEFNRLHEWVSPGDWVLDVGANVGNYAARLSKLVGPSGRVLAFEPVPETFELLSANVARFPARNVTTLNVAASDGFAERRMRVPLLPGGEANLYMAHLTDDGDVAVVSVAIDSLGIGHPITLVKIDVEGHELAALNGMRALLERDRPVLVIEGRSPAVESLLRGFGYVFGEEKGSPNRVFRCSASPTS